MRVTGLIGVQPVMPAGEVKISSVLKPHKSHKNKKKQTNKKLQAALKSILCGAWNTTAAQRWMSNIGENDPSSK